MKTLALAWRQLRRDLVAGDVRILFAALKPKRRRDWPLPASDRLENSFF